MPFFARGAALNWKGKQNSVHSGSRAESARDTSRVPRKSPIIFGCQINSSQAYYFVVQTAASSSVTSFTTTSVPRTPLSKMVGILRSLRFDSGRGRGGEWSKEHHERAGRNLKIYRSPFLESLRDLRRRLRSLSIDDPEKGDTFL